MSRIGRLPVELPQGVQAEVSGRAIKVTGSKGELTVPIGEGVTVREEENQLVLERASESPKHKAQHGLTRSLLYNAVTGVTDGFAKTLVIAGVGYRAQLQGQDLALQVGYSHPVTVEPRDGVSFEVPNPTTIVVRGIDKQKVGQLAAEIRKTRPPEPYKGKGIRYQDEQIRRKVGKAG
ncbi:ribosomal protein L6 [Rubrobacter radiotolerans]|uniref:Large ribosomal subunit protein uL6 n=1 Tax=Rubrobacter radiotolerans TaxID=42256 RepID=A0A023X4S3_RUBRA|nr:50S ribosomal protein L6 [Rubrobacter radiotolerans]AHY47211.1 ribosomal protein L6 [Rubrobacter radiotolerans]MDX5894614.1 50S ribosomal protein L6 [Rubrobacter radiotolerans]SMC06394.1 LSU ribosomal protein L6P [Rubrobacter radiotolerans DSM 5868]